MDIDHVFVCCSPGAPEAESLIRLGLREGTGGAHVGQGTANRRFFFANFYLELLWISRADEARSDATRRTQLWERWHERTSGASPFGVLLRPSYDGERPPFPTWEYRPAYLPPGLAIEFADGVPLPEPLLAYLPFARDSARDSDEPVDHALCLRRLDRVHLGVPAPAALSASARAVSAAAPLEFAAGEAVMDLLFDGSAGRVHDLRPALPLRLHGG